jgi:hypothetical protein
MMFDWFMVYILSKFCLAYEYWEKVKNIDQNNLVFLDEMGVLLGLKRTHARSRYGSRVYDLKPFYRGAKVTVLVNIKHFKNWFTSCCYCTS